MRWTSFFLATVAVSVSAASTFAQCNRGSRGGSGARTNSMANVGQFAPTSNFGSASTGVGFANTQLAQQYFRQQQIQQMRLLQAVAQRQLLANQKQEQLANAPEATETRSARPGATVARRDRLRLKNATKAYALAQRAESNDEFAAAERHYLRVTRIVGSDHYLGKKALSDIASLKHRDFFPTASPNSFQTRLAAAR